MYKFSHERLNRSFFAGTTKLTLSNWRNVTSNPTATSFYTLSSSFQLPPSHHTTTVGRRRRGGASGGGGRKNSLVQLFFFGWEAACLSACLPACFNFISSYSKKPQRREKWWHTWYMPFPHVPVSSVPKVCYWNHLKYYMEQIHTKPLLLPLAPSPYCCDMSMMSDASCAALHTRRAIIYNCIQINKFKSQPGSGQLEPEVGCKEMGSVICGEI